MSASLCASVCASDACTDVYTRARTHTHTHPGTRGFLLRLSRFMQLLALVLFVLGRFFLVEGLLSNF